MALIALGEQGDKKCFIVSLKILIQVKIFIIDYLLYLICHADTPESSSNED